jgi:hypothetical protein
MVTMMTSTFDRGLKNGYRSGLEDKVGQQITTAGLPLLYETDRVEYTWPARQSKYTPDFKLPKPGGFYYVETKGRWVTNDRAKGLLLKKQHPDIDIRYVFSNQRAKLYKGSPTTYEMYAQKHGLTFANKWIPQEWLDESLAALK